MKKAYLILIIAVLGSSCSTQVADEDGNVGSDIKMVLLEEISEEGKYLVIRSETFEIFSCYNYSLITRQQIQEDKITLIYSGISKPEICLTALGPARSLEIFSVENGIYDITFINDGIRNEGKLMVDNEKYVLELTDPKNVFVENEVLNKLGE